LLPFRVLLHQNWSLTRLVPISDLFRYLHTSFLIPAQLQVGAQLTIASFGEQVDAKAERADQKY
jgi:hypothetical protein